VVVGCWFVVTAFVQALVNPPIQYFATRINQGDFDYVLVRPEDAQALMSVQAVEPWPLVNVPVGIGFIAYGLNDSAHLQASPLTIGATVFTMLCGVVMLYSIMLLLATLCFWFIRVADLLFAVSDTFDAGSLAIGHVPALAAARAGQHRANRPRGDSPRTDTARSCQVGRHRVVSRCHNRALHRVAQVLPPWHQALLGCLELTASRLRVRSAGCGQAVRGSYLGGSAPGERPQGEIELREATLGEHCGLAHRDRSATKGR